MIAFDTKFVSVKNIDTVLILNLILFLVEVPRVITAVCIIERQLNHVYTIGLQSVVQLVGQSVVSQAYTYKFSCWTNGRMNGCMS
jgi:hypothetical protein